MSALVGKAYHPVNGATENIWEGFSWPCLFLGPLWYIHKGMWGWAVIACLLAPFIAPWFVLPSYANAQYANSLLKRGYLNEVQWNEKTSAGKSNSSPQPQQGHESIADELAKLARLKEQGVLSEDEFVNQKRRILA